MKWPKGTQTNTGRTHFKEGHIPANKGTTRPGVGGVKKGNIPWNKGLKGTQVAWNKGTGKPKTRVPREVWLKNLSLSHIGKMTGESNPRWKGGITPINQKVRTSPAYAAWRKHVFQRDDYTCQACGVRGVELHADHELPFAFYPDLRFEILNGRTLCVPCHRETPTYAGKANSMFI